MVHNKEKVYSIDKSKFTDSDLINYNRFLDVLTELLLKYIKSQDNKE